MATISAETAGIDEAHIRSVSEILEQERLEKEQNKNKTKQTLKNITGKAKGMFTKLENMSEGIDNIKNKLASMSEVFGDDSELGEMFAMLSDSVSSLKEDSKDIEQNSTEVESTLTGDDVEASKENKDSEKSSETKETKTLEDSTATKSETSKTGFNSSSKNEVYVPSTDTLNETKAMVDQMNATGGKGKLLKYTTSQMEHMSSDSLSNVIKSGFASDMKSQPVVSFMKSQVGAAAVIAPVAETVTKAVKKIKRLPEVKKPDVAFMRNALDINAPGFDANDYLVTSKDTSKLYENAVDFGDSMFFNGNAQPEPSVQTELSAEEKQAMRDAKFGRADADVDYSAEGEYTFDMPGGKF